MQALPIEYINKAISNPLEDQCCSAFHQGSCNRKSVWQFSVSFKSMFSMYLIVHLAPFVLFKRKKFANNPVEQLKKLVIAFFKSMLFACGYTAIVRRTMCFYARHYKMIPFSCTAGAVLASVTLIFEPIGRQSEIALYTLNKTVQSLYNMALRRKLPVRIPLGECLLAAVSMGIISYHYKNNKDAIRDSYRKVLNKLMQNI